MDYERYDEALSATRERRSERRASNVGKKKKDIITPILIMQSLICIVLLLSCFFVKLSDSSFYEKARLKYANLLTDKTLETQLTQNVLHFAKQIPAVQQVFEQVDGYIGDLAAMLHIDIGNDSSSSDLSTQESDTLFNNQAVKWAMQKGWSLYPQYPYLSKIHGTEQKSTTKTVEETTSHVEVQQTGTLNGQGGMIKVADPDNEEILTPPETATLAPVVLSAKPDLPVEGTITSSFGYRIHPTTGELDFHNAVDIAAASGTPITVALPGKVDKVVENDRIYGNYIVVKHSDNLSTKYAHCETILAKEGTVLRQGEIIAKVGSTGVSTGPHCHYEILVDGINVDPNWIYHFDKEEELEEA